MTIAAEVADPAQVGGDVAGSKGGGHQHLGWLVAGGERDRDALADQLLCCLSSRGGHRHFHHDAVGGDGMQGTAAPQQFGGGAAPGLEMQFLGPKLQGAASELAQMAQLTGLVGLFEQGGIGGDPKEQPGGQPSLPGAGVGRIEQEAQRHGWG